MTTKDQLRAVILECAEFFKREREFHTLDFVSGPIAERFGREFGELESKCWAVLGNPSIVECERIKTAGGGVTP